MNKAQLKLEEHLQSVIETAQKCFDEVLESIPEAKSRLVFIRENYLPIVSALSEATRNVND